LAADQLSEKDWNDLETVSVLQLKHTDRGSLRNYYCHSNN